jgi:hypothetical protein
MERNLVLFRGVKLSDRDFNPWLSDSSLQANSLLNIYFPQMRQPSETGNNFSTCMNSEFLDIVSEQTDIYANLTTAR